MKRVMIIFLMLQSFNLILCGNKEDQKNITMQRAQIDNY